MAVLRALGKGATLRVERDAEQYWDEQSEDLDKLLRIYDERSGAVDVSATGTVYLPPPPGTKGHGLVPLPQYNSDQAMPDRFTDWAKQAFKLDLVTTPGGFTNFVWAPYNLLGFYIAHEPFEDVFRKTHAVSLVSVVAVIASLLTRVLQLWKSDHGAFVRHWQRGYDGPSRRDLILSTLEATLPHALELVPLPVKPSEVDIEAAVKFLSLNAAGQEKIDVGLAGPHSVFLPCGNERWFVDYAWNTRRLHFLFHGLQINDQNFKGDALEALVRGGGSVLSSKQIFGFDNTSRQFDAAFDAGDALVIVECKVRARSLAVERGDPRAVSYRLAVVNEILRDADDKAVWLASHPIGKGYDVSRFRWVLGIGVSPFAEFIGSLQPYYWLTDTPQWTPENRP